MRERGVLVNDYTAQAVQLGTCHVNERQDGVSCQLFVTTQAVNLVTKRHPLARAAAALIRYQAGRAVYYAAVISKTPQETLERPRPPLEAIGLRIAHLYCSHYFGGRLSGLGQMSDEDFTASDELYSQTLAACFQGIADARLHFIQHRDVDAALLPALCHVEQMLCATASACAATCGEVGRWKASKSIEILKAVSLGDWFGLLSLDLGRFFDSHKDVAGDTDLVLLASHVERVLWSFGIVLSTPTSEQIWMDVFMDEQLENVRLMLRA